MLLEIAAVTCAPVTAVVTTTAVTTTAAVMTTAIAAATTTTTCTITIITGTAAVGAPTDKTSTEIGRKGGWNMRWIGSSSITVETATVTATTDAAAVITAGKGR